VSGGILVKIVNSRGEEKLKGLKEKHSSPDWEQKRFRMWNRQRLRDG